MKSLSNAVIAIPVYKETPDKYETISLVRCAEVLHEYDFCLFGPDGLNISEYENILAGMSKTFRYEAFDKSYFSSQRGYNHLMLTADFYKRFSSYEHMLIYQLDAYVFSNQMEKWCQSGYDYIGAPFFKLNKKIDWKNAGNGGFSLRKIDSFIKLFDHKGKILTWRGLWRYHRYRGPFHRLPLTVKGLFGTGNSVKYFTEEWLRHNEDLFYSMLNDSYLHWNIPSTAEAMFFSFEQAPTLLYSITKELPFGCHAFLKNEYEQFYKGIIEKNIIR